MKFCPVCNNSYPNHFRVCPQDNSVLRQANELLPGMVIRSKYEILSHVGGGGMADVYRVKHLAFNEVYAIKVVKANYADDEGFNHRFKSEAILTRKLRHPNAIAVEDYDTTEDGRPYIVMELVDGRDLRAVIDEQGPLPESRTLNLARQIASALAAAHKLGITHRDIKPDNILITADERGNEIAKVLDFGIAKVKEGSFTHAAYTATRQGMVVGTPQYMSPEQACGKVGDEIDGRADIYSLGVVMYEMITGKLPFESDTPMGYCFKHVHAQPMPPREFATNLNISPALSKLVMKMLEKDRGNRFSSMEELMAALADSGRWAGIQSPDAATIIRTSDDVATIVSHAVPDVRHPSSAPLATRPAISPKPSAQEVAPAVPSDTPIVPVQRKRKLVQWLAAAVVVLVLIGISIAVVGRHPAPSDDALHASAAKILHEHFDARGLLIDCATCTADVPHLNVHVEKGKVTLNGVAALDPARNDASIINSIAGIPGVTEVVFGDFTQPSFISGQTNSTLPGGTRTVANQQVSAGKDSSTTAPGPTSTVSPAPNPAPVTPAIINKSLTEDQKRAQELVAIGQQQLAVGNVDSAINRFGLALELDPSNTAAQSGLAKAKKVKNGLNASQR